MPIIKLSNRQYMIIDDLLDEFSVDFDFEKTSRDLNHAFAKIYGYRSTRSRPSRVRGGKRPSRVKKTYNKLNSWQIFVKDNSKKRKFRFKNGKLKLKSMGIAYRKTAAYKRSKK